MFVQGIHNTGFLSTKDFLHTAFLIPPLYFTAPSKHLLSPVMQINIFFPISDRETKPQTEISPANVKPKVSVHNKGPTQSPSEALQAFPNILMGFDS